MSNIKWLIIPIVLGSIIGILVYVAGNLEFKDVTKI